MPDMTDEQLRIKAAEMMGWTGPDSERTISGRPDRFKHSIYDDRWLDPKGEFLHQTSLPSPLTDLNDAFALMEKCMECMFIEWHPDGYCIDLPDGVYVKGDGGMTKTVVEDENPARAITLAVIGACDLIGDEGAPA